MHPPLLTTASFCKFSKQWNQIKVVSYNVLADLYAQDPIIEIKTALQNSSKNSLQFMTDWKGHREPLLLKEFESWHMDVLCIQEMQKSIYHDSWKEHMEKKLQMQSVLQSNEIPVAIAVFFKSEVFELKSVNSRSRAMIVELLHKPTNEKIFIATCHLEGTPERHKDRFTQLRSLLKELLKAAAQKEVKTQKIILAGDFNCSHQSGIYRLLQTGTLTKEDVDEYTKTPYTETTFSHPYSFSSVYMEATQKEPAFTFNIIGMKADPLDFMFYTKSNHLECVGVKQVFEDEQDFLDIKESGIPNAKHPSDHLPIGAIFQINTGNQL